MQPIRTEVSFNRRLETVRYAFAVGELISMTARNHMIEPTTIIKHIHEVTAVKPSTARGYKHLYDACYNRNIHTFDQLVDRYGKNISLTQLYIDFCIHSMHKPRAGMLRIPEKFFNEAFAHFVEHRLVGPATAEVLKTALRTRTLPVEEKVDG